MANIIENLGQIKAQIAALQKQEKVLVEQVKQSLINGEKTEEVSDHYRALLTISERTSISKKGSEYLKKNFPSESEFFSNIFVETLNVEPRKDIVF